MTNQTKIPVPAPPPGTPATPPAPGPTADDFAAVMKRLQAVESGQAATIPSELAAAELGSAPTTPGPTPTSVPVLKLPSVVLPDVKPSFKSLEGILALVMTIGGLITSYQLFPPESAWARVTALAVSAIPVVLHILNRTSIKKAHLQATKEVATQR